MPLRTPSPILPLARTPVLRYVLWCFTVMILLWACDAYQHPELEPRQVGWKPDRDLTTYLDTTARMNQLEEIGGVKAQLDSLLEWTDLLNYYHKEEALYYANKAYELAVARGHRFSQSLAMYYRALLKGRMQIFGEGTEDALADVIISKKLITDTDDPVWRIRINSLLGYLYWRTRRLESSNVDSARYYVNLALNLTEVTEVPGIELNYLKSQLNLDLARSYMYSDTAKAMPLFEQAIEQAQAAANPVLESAIWQMLGVYYKSNDQYDLADSVLNQSVALLTSVGDQLNIVSVYQKLADLRNYQFVDSWDTTYYHASMEYLDKCLAIPHENLYYTYELFAYNYDEYLYLSGDPPSRYSAEGDSAIVYYNKALVEAKKEGDLSTMEYMVINIGTVCEHRERLTGGDCKELLGDQDYKEYLNSNYAALVENMRDKQQESNERIREAESRLTQTVNDRRMTIAWITGAAGLVMSILVFLLLLQGQRNQRLQARMEALRAQINPHFMSNSLNAIEHLVNMDRRKEASKYLIHFSRLTRKLLNSSRDPVTSLADELTTLKHFLALEQLRFRDKLSYTITVEEGLDAQQIEVPALILQPYVENAILHGIKPKSEPSLLKIRVNRSDAHLECYIEDDGIGRKKAAELKAQSALKKQHQSQGMKITEERLAMIGKTKGAKVQIVDLQHSDGTAAGTQVIVRFPYRLISAPKNP